MKKLTITKADGSFVWSDVFETQAHLDKWLNEEKTRRNWETTFVVSVEDKPVLPAVEPAEVTAQKEAAKKAMKDLEAFDEAKIKTLGDLIEICRIMMIAAGIKK